MEDIWFPNLGVDGIGIPHLETGITIFGFQIAFYGMTMAVGMLAGLLIARWQAKRTGQNPDVYSDFALYAIIFSVIGARLYYVIFSWEDYQRNLLQIFNTRGGGMALYGSVIGGFLTAVIYAKRKKYSLPLLIDTSAVGLLLGQIIGRWGNFFNREAFGGYTNSLLAMRLKVSDVSPSSISDSLREHIIEKSTYLQVHPTLRIRTAYIEYIQVHPTFLYELLWNIGVLIIIILYTKHKKFDGELFIMYLIGYGLGRLWIEGLRTDQLQLFGVAVSQVLSGVLVVVGVACWLVFRRKAARRKKPLVGV